MRLLIERLYAVSVGRLDAQQPETCASDFGDGLRSGVGWLHWPCGQNPGRHPEGRRHAASVRDDGASANTVPLQGQHSLTCYRETRPQWIP